MSPPARNRPVKLLKATSVTSPDEQPASQPDDDGVDPNAGVGAVRNLDDSGVLDPVLREKLDKLEREYATILTRLDRMASRHRRLAARKKTGH